MDPARVRVFTRHVMSKFKSFHEALEPFSLEVGLFFMLAMSPFAIIIYHVFFNCLLVEHLKNLHRMFGFFKAFWQMFAILFFKLCEMFGHECCVVCNFYKKKEKCIARFFKFLHFLQMFLGILIWHLLTCAHQSKDLSMFPFLHFLSTQCAQTNHTS